MSGPPDIGTPIAYPPSSYSRHHSIRRLPPPPYVLEDEPRLDHESDNDIPNNSLGLTTRQTLRGVSPFDDRHSISADKAAQYVPAGYEQNALGLSPFSMNHIGMARSPSPTDYEPPLSPLRQPTSPGYRMTVQSPPQSSAVLFGPTKPRATSTPMSSTSTSAVSPDAPPINPPEAETPFPHITAPSRLQPIQPSFARLYAFFPWRERLILLLPALAFALGCSAVPPLMSLMVGNAFGAMAAYPRDGTATQADKDKLMSDVALTSARFALIGTGAVILEYLKQVAWTRFSEATTARLRTIVFHGVKDKPMEWFDTGMGMKEDQPKSRNDSKAPSKGVAMDSIGAGGLMNKFARETDEVRMATALPSGVLVQNVSTVFICVIMSMTIQPLLALVSLASVPVVILTTTVIMRLAQPSLAIERRAGALAATNVQRATGAIETVKGHNAQADEHARFMKTINTILGQIYRQSFLWPTATGIVEFSSLAMFVAAFWFGAKLIDSGKATVTEVHQVFWSCMFAAGALQSLSRLLTPLLKGSASLASLLTVIQERHVKAPARPRFVPVIRRHPRRCRGGFELKEVFFSYPSRLKEPVLRGINMFLPPGETTFVVGGNGSGKSTVAQLLLRLYSPSGGEIVLDNHELDSYDNAFTSSHIALVSQGCVLFDLSVHDNVALGILNAESSAYGVVRRPSDVTRAEVIDACKLAHIHDYIESLPQGYNTMLENNGAALSGGQRQRLAIARARIRDPTVLVLDEATRALDPTSRVAVFENIKKWRRNSTTIVISHDLSQITPEDFVYVMQNGHIVEQGYRKDLMEQATEFAAMAAHQVHNPVSDAIDFSWRDADASEVGQMLDEINDDYLDIPQPIDESRHTLRPHSGLWDLDVLHQYERQSRRSSWFLDTAIPDMDSGTPSRPVSRQRQRASRTSARLSGVRNSTFVIPTHKPEQAFEKGNMEVMESPPSSAKAAGQWTRVSLTGQPASTVRSRFSTEKKPTSPDPAAPANVKPEPLVGYLGLARRFYPTIPHKFLLFLGLLFAVVEGASMPIWSFFIAQVLALLGVGSIHQVTMKGLTVLGITAARGFAIWASMFFLFRLSGTWQHSMRAKSFDLVLKQDKSWFDDEKHGASAIAHSLVKDIEDIGPLFSSVSPGIVVVLVMVLMSLIWAMVAGWQLTLVGLALGPIILLVSTFANGRLAVAEKYNKARRDAVAQTFYEYIANVLGIRCMSLESHFSNAFDKYASEAKAQAQRAVFVTAIGPGLSAGMMLFAQALMNWAGAMFIQKGIITFADMLSVYSLILFGISNAVASLSFLPKLTKAKVAARDGRRFMDLSPLTREMIGFQRFPMSGHVAFNNVTFAYPLRPDVIVLRDLNFTIAPGECVAIVGPSGSGKSTVAALLQRLYDPSKGGITIGDNHNIAQADVPWLRSHIAIVSQKDNLFDGTVAENIAYGSDAPLGAIKRAATEAHIHDFIVTRLPKGYDEPLGENASLLSGGQRQRLQLARALVRRSRILLLDECTSQLDPESQKAVLDTIVAIKKDRTTIFITHSKEAMRRCDRIICLEDGRVAESGTYDALMRKGGAFAKLVSAGEVQD